MRIGMYKYQREYIRVTRIGHMSGSGFGVQVQGLKIGLEMKMRIETET